MSDSSLICITDGLRTARLAEVKAIARKIFVDMDVESTRRRCTIGLESTGRSGTRVFCFSYDKEVADSSGAPELWIAKLHVGLQAHDTATREFNAKNGSPLIRDGSLFLTAKCVIEAEGCAAVIYPHASRILGCSSMEVSSLAELLDSIDVGKISQTCERIAHAYKESDNTKNERSSNYLNEIVDYFSPSHVLRAKWIAKQGEELYLSSKDVAPTERSLDQASKMRVSELKERLQEAQGEESPDWRVLEFESLGQETVNERWLRLKDKNNSVLIEVAEQELPYPKNTFDVCTILVHSSVLIEAYDKYMQDLGFSGRPVSLNFNELREGFGPNARVEVGHGHRDLHVGNIIGTTDELRVIDLGDFGDDLIVTDLATLETSLWKECTDKIPEDVARKFIEDPITGAHQKFFDSVLAIRNGFLKGWGDRQQTYRDQVLAYTVQCLVYQRFAALNSEKISPAFSQYVSTWFQRFLRLHDHPEGGAAEPPIRLVDLERLKSSASTATIAEEVEEPSQALADGRRVATLGDLWERGLKAFPTLSYKPEIDLFMAAARENRPGYFDKDLKSLQTQLYEHEDFKDFFRKPNNVLISGPTSSGKTTLAELYLLGPAITGGTRPKSVYIAPTKVLTQVKHKELVELAKGTSLEGRIIISTGENSEEDSRIAVGDFSVLCMVTEKANVLFTNALPLFDKIGAVVVDETHLINDSTRGPILEILITKFLRHQELTTRREQQTGDSSIRIIPITTESHNDEGLRDYLKVYDVTEGVPIEPLMLVGKERPTIIRHALLLPGENVGSSVDLEIVKFERTEQRFLSEDHIRDVQGEIREKLDASYKSKGTKHRSKKRARRKTPLEQWILEWLEKNPKGRRILVFANSQNKTVKWANWLAETRKKENQVPLELDATFRESWLNIEDVDEQKEIEAMALYGVYVHHAGVNKAVRGEIERCSSNNQPNEISQVIFATETLSYGVNLAVHDVLLVGVKFQKQSRDGSTDETPLTSVEYHNMAGRAGRLGKVEETDCSVYVLVDGDLHALREKCDLILDRYYHKISPIRSALFDENEDKRKYDESDRSATSLEITDFSYPFARCVIDVLRHLNSLETSALRQRRAKVSNEQLYKFFRGSLFWYQAKLRLAGRDNARANLEKAMNDSIDIVLRSGAKDPLRIVDKQETNQELRFEVNLRGEAVIDTGTRFDTVQPAIQFATRLMDLWADVFEDRTIDLELFILVLLAQEEVFRSRNAIESTVESSRQQKTWSDEMVASSRSYAKQRLLECMKQVGTNEQRAEMTVRLIKELDEWPPLSNVDSEYDLGSTDSVIRLYTAIHSWINGESSKRVRELLSGYVEPVHLQMREMSSSFPRFEQYCEWLSWKILFLVKLLVSDPDKSRISGAQERDLYKLAWRTRFGCKLEVIPLIRPNDKSRLNRFIANQIFEQGYTPQKLILSQDRPSLDLPDFSDRVDVLPRELIEYSITEHKNLLRALTLRAGSHVGEPSDEKAEKTQLVIDLLMQQLLVFYEDSARQYNKRNERPCNNYQEAVNQLTFEELFSEHRSSLTFDTVVELRNRFRIISSMDESGFLQLTQEDAVVVEENDEGDRVSDNIHWKSSESKVGSVVLLQFNTNGQASVNGKGWRSIDEIVEGLGITTNVIFVCFPWIPTEVRELQQSIVRNRVGGRLVRFLTPSAFAVLLVFTIRDLFSGRDLFAWLLGESTKCPPSLVDSGVLTAFQVLEFAELENRKVIAPIRDPIVQHFEPNAHPVTTDSAWNTTESS